MKPHRTRAFFAAWHLMPHRTLGRAVGALMRIRRPRRLVRAAIAHWARRDGIDLGEVEAEDWPHLESFFLRRLKAGARPVADGLASPADGVLVASGRVASGTLLQVKGRPYSLDRLVNGRGRRRSPIPVEAFEGGTFVTVFLTPAGYHFVHAPWDGALVGVHWRPGRFFPQNADALRHIDGIYPRNERAVLRFRLAGGAEALLVMVGASLIGGISVVGLAPADLMRPDPLPLDRPVRRGDELGHFRFGSTVVLVLPPGLTGAVEARPGDVVKMGQRLSALNGPGGDSR